MPRKPKCYVCKEEVDKDTSYKKGNRYYHILCYEEFEKKKDERKELIDYICQLHNLEAPTGLILKQIKDFQEQYNYTLKGMTLTLKYFHETLGNPVREGDGIGIIPFMYEEAKKYFILKREVNESLEFLNQQKEAKIIEIEPPKFSFTRSIQPIDINSL
jgi:hypothetical protein